MKLSTAFGECPICSGQARLWREKTVEATVFKIRRCDTCSFGFVDPRPDELELRAFYLERGHCSEFQSVSEVASREIGFPNSSIDASRISRILTNLEARGTLLDVGAGFGFFSREAKRSGFDVVALELGQLERECIREIAGIDAVAKSFEEFVSPESFDIILMSQILEHASDVNRWIRKAHSLLTERGVLCIALPNFDSFLRYMLSERDPYVTPPQHLNFFNSRSLELLLAKHDFEIVRAEHVSRLPLDVISKRVRKGSALLKQLTRAINAGLSCTVDPLGRGIMLNIYSRKRRSA